MALVNVKRIYIYSLYSLLLLGLANCGAFQGVASFSLDPNSQNLSSDSSLVSDDINGNDINNTNGSFNIGDQGFVEVPTFQENDPSQQQADQQNYVQRQEELMRQHTQQRNQELAELSALNNRSEAEERLNFVQMREHLRIREIEGIGIEYMNITHHTSHRYNFVGPDASSCERAVKNGLNIDVKCSVGGGCGHDCGLPGSNCPSANPDLHGVCVEMVGPVILRYTPPSLARLGELINFDFNIDLPSRGATPVASCTMEYAPVCGTNGRTYGNSCVAREANATVAYSGACQAHTAPNPGNVCEHELVGSLCLDLKDVNRFYQPNIGDHFYSHASASCAGQNNCDNEMLAAYDFERVEFRSPVSGPHTNQLVRLLRAWNPSTGDHLYTLSQEEFQNITTNLGYQAEGGNILVSSSPRAGFVPLYRWYNPTNGDHFYTISASEQCMGQSSNSIHCGGETVNEGGWHYEGITAYVVGPKNGNQCPHSMIGGLCLQTQDVNRFYLPTVGDHFYSVASASCAGQNNCDNEMLGAYEFERTEFKTPVNISVANQRHFVRLLRAWNPTSGDHIYTTNLEEFNAITSSGLYRAENAELWVSPTPRAGFVALYRWYNSTNGDHFYTISANEQCMGQTSSSAQCGGETVNEGGWHYEGVAGYVIEP